MLPAVSGAESFTAEERARLAPFFTNLDGHVFALTNLPETVKGALFARYSRSAKSLRRLFLDEFADKVSDGGAAAPEVPSTSAAVERAERLYARVFSDYGDDSVAQLGGAHIACEYVSNVLTKVLEWGRLMSYLEQSTRYVPYTDRLHDRWRYHVPAELEAGALREQYVRAMDAAFECYAEWIPRMQEYFAARHPRGANDSEARAPRRHPGQGARHAPRSAACRDAVERRAVRQRPGVRVAAAAHARASAARGARLRRRDARRAAQDHPGVPDAARSAGSRRPVVAVSRRRAPCHRSARRRSCCTESRPTSARKSRSATSIPTARPRSSPRRSTHRLRCPTISCSPSCGRWRRTIRARGAARLRRRPRQPPASPGPRLRADVVSLRRPHRLRGVPRPAAPPAADPRMAAADDEARLQRAGGDGRGRRQGRVAAGDGRIRRAARAAPCGRTCGDCARTRWRWPTACASTWT